MPTKPCVVEKDSLNLQQILIMTKATLSTKYGDMVIEFYDQDAPKTVENFVRLAKSGFYDGIKFHRVIPDFVVQGGDPTGTGAGGPGYSIPCELTGGNQYHDRGVLSMAHAGRDTGGSQFFICHNRTRTQHLDRNHTCFGKVVENVDIVDQIRQGDLIEKIRVHEEAE
jgi:peptidyl-prolyl cis-trans isomerase B (cyclophilin B)